MKILFICPYPFDRAPSQRFRYEQYLPYLLEKGWAYRIAPFIDEPTWNILYKPGHTAAKVLGILKGFFKRFFQLFTLHQYSFVFIHREAAPVGPPVFEWLIAKVWRKKIIYDFDDAIWLPNTSENNKIAASIKWHHKVASICKWSYKVSCGNAYLQEYASRFNAKAFYNPTTIDTENLHNPALYPKPIKTFPVIGWTGTHSTLVYLEPVIEVLKKLETKYEFEFCVIANKDPMLPLQSYRFVQWTKETEIQDLLRFDIGLMPLGDDMWAKGKCGFKALQYMALGIPAVASPVGVNTAIIKSGVNGCLCRDRNEWFFALESLLINNSERIRMGSNARYKIEIAYSVLANKNSYIDLFSLYK